MPKISNDNLKPSKIQTSGSLPVFRLGSGLEDLEFAYDHPGRNFLPEIPTPPSQLPEGGLRLKHVSNFSSVSISTVPQTVGFRTQSSFAQNGSIFGNYFEVALSELILSSIKGRANVVFDWKGTNGLGHVISGLQQIDLLLDRGDDSSLMGDPALAVHIKIYTGTARTMYRKGLARLKAAQFLMTQLYPNIESVMFVYDPFLRFAVVSSEVVETIPSLLDSLRRRINHPNPSEPRVIRFTGSALIDSMAQRADFPADIWQKVKSAMGYENPLP